MVPLIVNNKTRQKMIETRASDKIVMNELSRGSFANRAQSHCCTIDKYGEQVYSSSREEGNDSNAMLQKRNKEMDYCFVRAESVFACSVHSANTPTKRDCITYHFACVCLFSRLLLLYDSVFRRSACFFCFDLDSSLLRFRDDYLWSTYGRVTQRGQNKIS